MSLLLAGPSSIKPWIEDTVFQALVHGPAAEREPQRSRLGQVLAMRGFEPEGPTRNGHCNACTARPCVLVLHDGQTSIICSLNSKPQSNAVLPTKGCIVRISNYKVSLVERCCRCHCPGCRRSDAVSYYLDMNPRICLDATSFETLGGHGNGIVGNPVHVHRSVPVRRALLFLDSKKKSLGEQLKLVTPLGNVQALFNSSGVGQPLPVIQSLVALAKKDDDEKNNKTATRQKSRVRLGNVQDLLESSKRSNGQGDNPFHRLVALAKQNFKNTPFHDDDKPQKINNVVLGDVRALLSGNNANGVTVNRVLQCARQMDSTLARGGSAMTEGPTSEIAAGEMNKDLQTGEMNKDLQTGIPSVMEPYDVRETVDRDDSFVSRLLLPTKRAPQKSNIVLGDVRALLSGNDASAVTLNRVLQSARQMDSTLARGGSAMTDGPSSEIGAGETNKDLQTGIPSAMDSHDVRETVDRHNDSFVSVSGTQSDLSASAAVRELLVSEADTRETELARPPLANVPTIGDATNEDDSGSSDKDSDIAGISDMLISQTQDDDASEQIPLKKRSLGATNEGSTIVGDAAAPPQMRTKPATKGRPRTLLQHVLSQARKGDMISQTQDEDASEQNSCKKRSLAATNEGSPLVDDDAPPQKRRKPTTKNRPRSLLQYVMSKAGKVSKTSELQTQEPVTTKRSGMLSSWLAQRVRPKGR